MSEGISRRQFVGGAAAVAAASALPVVTSAAPAVAAPNFTVASLAIAQGAWGTDRKLDEKQAGRMGWSIYWSRGGISYGG
jgi:hypothetical protein